MKQEPIVVEQTYKASVAEVWEALTNKEEMKEWYFDLEEFRPEVGFKFQFLAGTEEKKFLHLCRITEVLFRKKIAYTWAYDGVPVETVVSFELFEEGPDQTKVRLTHVGVDQFPADNKDLARGNFVEGWNAIIGTNLKNYVEKKHTVEKEFHKESENS